MAVDLTKLNFDSRLNYLKRSEFVGSETVSLTGTNNEVKTVTVNHGLGYIPFFTVGVTTSDNSIIWSSNRAPRNVALSAGWTEPVFYYWITTSTLTIKLRNALSGASSGTRTVYWAIYLDYGES